MKYDVLIAGARHNDRPWTLETIHKYLGGFLSGPTHPDFLPMKIEIKESELTENGGLKNN